MIFPTVVHANKPYVHVLLSCQKLPLQNQIAGCKTETYELIQLKSSPKPASHQPGARILEQTTEKPTGQGKITPNFNINCR